MIRDDVLMNEKGGCLTPVSCLSVYSGKCVPIESAVVRLIST